MSLKNRFVKFYEEFTKDKTSREASDIHYVSEVAKAFRMQERHFVKKDRMVPAGRRDITVMYGKTDKESKKLLKESTENRFKRYPWMVKKYVFGVMPVAMKTGITNKWVGKQLLQMGEVSSY